MTFYIVANAIGAMLHGFPSDTLKVRIFAAQQAEKLENALCCPGRLKYPGGQVAAQFEIAILYTGLCIALYFAFEACSLTWTSLLVLSTEWCKLAYRNTGTGLSNR